MTSLIFSRSIGPVPIGVVISETHDSELEVTENPVEFGANVTDHAYMMPNKVTMECATGSSLAEAARTFAALKAFQESRVPFTLITPIMIYRNMIIKKLSPVRDKEKSNILSFSAEIREIILVNTAAYSFSSTQPQAALGSNSSRTASSAAKTTQSALRSETSAASVINKATSTLLRGNLSPRDVDISTATQEGQRHLAILKGLA